jgi:hypothetical protein
MKDALGRKLTRRQFLRSMGRYLALGLILAVGALLAGRRRGRGRNVCINRGLCGSCGALEGCRLPRARSARWARSRRLP